MRMPNLFLLFWMILPVKLKLTGNISEVPVVPLVPDEPEVPAVPES